MEVIILGFAIFGAYVLWTKSIKPFIKQASKDINYYIQCQAYMMDMTGINLPTAKAFVADYQHMFYDAHKSGLPAEDSCTFVCLEIAGKHLLSGQNHNVDRDMFITHSFILGYATKYPDSPLAKEYNNTIGKRMGYPI
jgi:hypothetical protein